MRTIRCHVDAPLAPGGVAELPEAAAAHLVRVLRLGPGDALVLFNGDGHDYPSRLLEAGKRGARAQVLDRIAPAKESPLRLTLAQGIARGEKMDWILQKATELGVSAIAPVQTERTEVKLDAERADKRLQHWAGVIAAACEQSGRARLPTLAAPASLAHWAAGAGEDLKLVLDPEGELTLRELPAADSACLVVGPEGGLSPRDLALLKAAGFRGLRLGPRVLRTETAGIAGVALLQAALGDLAGGRGD